MDWYKALAEKIYPLLTTNTGLSQLWTNDVSGAGYVGSVIKFRINDVDPDFINAELITNKVLPWKHSGNMPEARMATETVFNLGQQDAQTFVRFTHLNWRESSDFMAHCSAKWAVFILSLKDAAETAKGKPFPDDIQIEHS